MDVDVADSPELKRYEARIGEELAGFAEYQITDEIVVMTHTEVFDAFEGKGIGSALVRGALDDVRGKGLSVLPLCPFVGRFIDRHSEEYGELRYTSRTKPTVG